MPDPFTRVTVLGGGVLGAQIAAVTAIRGFAVRLFDVDDAAVAAARTRLAGVGRAYAEQMPGVDAHEVQRAVEGVETTRDLEQAVGDADLVIEAVPEHLELKRDVWRRAGAAAPARTVFATNSSALLPSAIADATGRPDRFLALHFANRIWVQNTAEIMGHPGTDPAVLERVAAFAEAIGMVPIRLHREQPGYVLNSLLIPLLSAAAGLLLKGVADPATIDATWRTATGAPAGPFQIFDVIGLRTAYAMSSSAPDEGNRAFAELLKTRYLDQGKLGVESGEGFYTYS